MIIRICFWFVVGSIFMGCAALSSQISEDMAPQISTEVAVQVGTEVFIQVGTAIGEQTTLETASVDRPGEVLDPPYDCSAKTCGRMDSCEEAVYKLYVCDHRNRDANNDGVPCESLCKGADVPSIATSFASISPTPIPTSPAGSEDIGRVTRVIDGDTIDVRLGDKTVRIRYVQTNTPERDEPCFRESTQANADLVANKTVRLLPSERDEDPFGRLLRFVYVGDIMVERVLVEQGFAEVVLYPSNDTYYEEFKRLEQEAAAAGRGCHPTGIFDDGTTTR
ncbi:MAG: thermonuclease family protein [Chloroflexi bacterium]|nr:thermonuclease family protein [Chloroflexota bacterium]